MFLRWPIGLSQSQPLAQACLASHGQNPLTFYAWARAVMWIFRLILLESLSADKVFRAT